MSNINVLSEKVIRYIASGEFITNPYLVLKELIENSIDAYSTIIKVYIENNGLYLIQVNDNGIGIPKKDLLLVINRHTTSKIVFIDDLYTFISYGFRGEALSSISSVSHFSLISKTYYQNIGWKISNSYNNLLGYRLSPYSCLSGTIVKVKNFFLYNNIKNKYNFKKRVSFLNEWLLIKKIFFCFSLIHTHINFYLYRDSKLLNLFLCSDNNKETLKKRIIDIYGLNFYKSSYEININSNDILLSGIYNLFQKNVVVQLIFINKRIITDNNIVILIIKKFFKEFFYKIISCSYILFLTISNQWINVNIHPNKNNIEILNVFKICNCINQNLLYFFSKNKYFSDEYKNFLFIKNKYSLSLNKIFDFDNIKQLKYYYANCFFREFGIIINIIHNRYVLIQKKNNIYITDFFLIYYIYNKYLITNYDSNIYNKVLSFSLKKKLKFSIDFNINSIFLLLLNKIGFCIEQHKNYLYLLKIPLFFYRKNIEYLLVRFLCDVTKKKIKSWKKQIYILSQYVLDCSCGWNNEQIMILLIELSKFKNKHYLQGKLFYILNLKKIYKYLIF